MDVPTANSVPASITVASRYAPALVRCAPSLATEMEAGTSATNGSAISFHSDVIQTYVPQRSSQRDTATARVSGRQGCPREVPAELRLPSHLLGRSGCRPLGTATQSHLFPGPSPPPEPASQTTR
jgi:hypothetical protein